MLRFAPQLLLVIAACVLGVASCSCLESSTPSQPTMPTAAAAEQSDATAKRNVASSPTAKPSAKPSKKAASSGWFASSGPRKPGFKLPEDAAEARAAILAQIPIGTTADAAKAKLDELDFTTYNDTDDTDSGFHTRYDQATDSMWVSRNYLIFVRLNERAAVADVEVRIAFTGP